MRDPDHQPPQPGCIAAILPAAGSGQRFGSAENKLCTLLSGKPLWVHSAERLRAQSLIGRIVMPISERDRDYFCVQQAKVIARLGVELISGGAERTDSVQAGLDVVACDDSVRLVAVHDAARPLVSSDDLSAVLSAATGSGAAILAAPIAGTVRRSLGHSHDGERTETIDRRHLYVALTPQVFNTGLLVKAYAQHNGRPATDDAQLVERLGHCVQLVVGSADNLKITYPEDLLIAEAILARQATA